MKGWLARLGIVFVLCAGALAPAVHLHAGQEVERQDPKTITVYITRTGEKYHRDGCRYLSQSKIAMSLAEAARRYGPCSVCRPPTLKD